MASRSSDVGSSFKSSIEHAVAQFVSSVHLPGGGQGSHGDINQRNNGSGHGGLHCVPSLGFVADGSIGTHSAQTEESMPMEEHRARLMEHMAQAAGSASRAEHRDAEANTLSSADPLAGSACSKVEELCGKAQSLVLQMSAAVVPPSTGRSATGLGAHAARAPHVASAPSLEAELAELRARVSRVELRLEQRSGRANSPSAEARAEALALRKELAELQDGLAEALRELGETKSQVRALKQQVGVAPGAVEPSVLAASALCRRSTQPDFAGTLEAQATPTQVLTPSYPRSSLTAAAPPSVGPLRACPASPLEATPCDSCESRGQTWMPAQRMSSAAGSEQSAGVAGNKGAAELLEAASTPTQLLTPSHPRPLMMQAVAPAGGALGTARSCLASPPETARLPHGQPSARLSAQLSLAAAARTCTPAQQPCGRPAGQEHLRLAQPQLFQPTPRTSGTPPAMHVCHTPGRGGTCPRAAGQGAGTPVYPARRTCIRGGA